MVIVVAAEAHPAFQFRCCFRETDQLLPWHIGHSPSFLCAPFSLALSLRLIILSLSFVWTQTVSVQFLRHNRKKKTAVSVFEDFTKLCQVAPFLGSEEILIGGASSHGNRRHRKIWFTMMEKPSAVCLLLLLCGLVLKVWVLVRRLIC